MKQPPEDLRAYRKFYVTLLQLMAFLAAVGIVGTVVLDYLFY
jgi:hypothetical protein